jgi:hypothetical protein
MFLNFHHKMMLPHPMTPALPFLNNHPF